MEVTGSILQNSEARSILTVHRRRVHDTLQTKHFPLESLDIFEQKIQILNHLCPRSALSLILSLVDWRMLIPTYISN